MEFLPEPSRRRRSRSRDSSPVLERHRRRRERSPDHYRSRRKQYDRRRRRREAECAGKRSQSPPQKEAPDEYSRDRTVSKQRAPSGVMQYLVKGPRNAGLADDRRLKSQESESIEFCAYSKKVSSAGLVVQDDYARGIRPDLAPPDREFPYQCEHCDSEFLTALQLSDHLLECHNIRMHASLLKPKSAKSIAALLDTEDDDDDHNKDLNKKRRPASPSQDTNTKVVSTKKYSAHPLSAAAEFLIDDDDA